MIKQSTLIEVCRERMAPSLEHVIFRIIQESLTNAAGRYSQRNIFSLTPVT